MQNTHQHVLSAHDSLIGQNLELNVQVQKLETRSEYFAKLQTACEIKFVAAAEIEVGLRRQIAELERGLVDDTAASKKE